MNPVQSHIVRGKFTLYEDKDNFFLYTSTWENCFCILYMRKRFAYVTLCRVPSNLPFLLTNKFWKGEFFVRFFVLYSTLLHLTPLRFYCLGGCCYWTQGCMQHRWYFFTVRRLIHSASSPLLYTRLDLIHTRLDLIHTLLYLIHSRWDRRLYLTHAYSATVYLIHTRLHVIYSAIPHSYSARSHLFDQISSILG